MTDKAPSRFSSLWLAFLLALLAFVCNVLPAMGAPAPHAYPWISLGLAILAIIFLLAGLGRLFRTPGGKVLGSILGLVTLLIVAVNVLAFVTSHRLPASTKAPQIGQKAPEFTLPDTQGRPVALAQLFASDNPQAQPTKAVLLVFYRGYW